MSVINFPVKERQLHSPMDLLRYNEIYVSNLLASFDFMTNVVTDSFKNELQRLWAKPVLGPEEIIKLRSYKSKGYKIGAFKGTMPVENANRIAKFMSGLFQQHYRKILRGDNKGLYSIYPQKTAILTFADGISCASSQIFKLEDGGSKKTDYVCLIDSWKT